MQANNYTTNREDIRSSVKELEYIVNTNNGTCVSMDNCSYSTTGDFSPKQSFLSVMHVNCRSLNKNVSSLSELLLTLKYRPSVIAMSETWLKEGDDQNLCLPSYCLVSSPRTQKRGGGVGFYVDANLNFSVITLKSVPSDHDVFESITIEIFSRVSSNIIITCLYRTQDTSVDIFNTELDKLLSLLNIGKKLFILTGDFNLNLLKLHHPPTRNFYDLLLCHGLTPTITKPTRVTEFSATLIDHIHINTMRYPYTSTIFYDDISDHYPILIELCIKEAPVHSSLNKMYRSYDAKSINKFCNQIATHSWSTLIELCETETDSSVLYDCFFNDFFFVYDEAFPLKMRQETQSQLLSNPWMTPNLIKCCKKKSKLFKKYKKCCTTKTKANFIKYRNILKKTIQSAEKMYYATKFSENSLNAQKTWLIINEILSKPQKRSLVNCLTDPDGKLLTNLQAAEMFNEYFSNIGANLAEKIATAKTDFSHYMPNEPAHSAVFGYTDLQEIENIIKGLKSVKSVGHDEISTKIIKLVAHFISAPLTALINNSLANGIFPAALKIGKIVPIWKNGEKNLVSNYRPISILSCFLKIYEKTIEKRLRMFLLKFSIPSENQFGFQKKKSTYMAIASVVDEISLAIDNKKYSIGVFIDLCKAFDTVNHDILLKKLEMYGIRGLPLCILKSYLLNRTQFVDIDGIKSSPRHIACGVPQGSILGPLLFLIYVDDMQYCSKLLKFVLFADDTNLFSSSSSMDMLFDVVNAELCNLSDYLKANRLSLNVKKSHYILFGKKKLFWVERILFG